MEAARDALPGAPEAAGRARAVDGLGVLTAYAVCLLLVPSRLVVGPLGAAGTPATLAALVALGWYLISWIAGRRAPSPASRRVRLAAWAFLGSVLASFAAGMLRDIDGKEVLAAERGLILAFAWLGVVLVAA